MTSAESRTTGLASATDGAIAEGRWVASRAQHDPCGVEGGLRRVNMTVGLPSVSIGTAVCRPDTRQSATRIPDGRRSLRLLVVLLIVSAPTEHSLGDPIGELVLH